MKTSPYTAGTAPVLFRAFLRGTVAAAAAATIVSAPALAQSGAPQAAGAAIATGEDIYRHNCMACHMADGKGAQGAGRFPALAGNPALTAAGYPIFVVLNGLGGMPWFNGVLSDDEIAAVVSYVRTHFGNHYTEPVKPEDVALMRGPVPRE